MKYRKTIWSIALILFYFLFRFIIEGKTEAKNYYTIISYTSNGQCGTDQNRQTGDPADRWKVKLSTSGEGKGTYTTFWLENYDGDNVSKTVDVKQGKGYYYRPSYRSGCKTHVWLTAVNNNFNSNSYEVSGCWDEETGVFKNKN